jgi:transcriptional regulator with XRE-family HTH domain
MEQPGQKLRRARERLKLKYRDVVESSQRLAEAQNNTEFSIGLSRLADIENKGTVPSIFRLYSLCAIYKLNFTSVLRWYGVNLDRLPVDAFEFARQNTVVFDVDIPDRFPLDLPVALASTFDIRKTSYLGEQIATWGKVPAGLLTSVANRRTRYGLIGTEDWSMAPLIPPGSFLQIDPRSRHLAEGGWVSEYERPVYFLEHRDGYLCAWCSLHGNSLGVQFHPSSGEPPQTYAFPGQIEVVGQVVGVAMRLDQAMRRRIHS